MKINSTIGGTYPIQKPKIINTIKINKIKKLSQQWTVATIY